MRRRIQCHGAAWTIEPNETVAALCERRKKLKGAGLSAPFFLYAMAKL
jgi:hypothetical protein